VNTRLDRIEEAVRTMAWWLVQAQTGFGQQDARGIEDILDGKPSEADEAVPPDGRAEG
jgi:hypothetical protein